MTKLHEAADLRGKQVVGADGSKIGKVDEVFLGAASGEPEWALVNTGLFGLRSSFVLITGAEDRDGDLAVPFDKGTVKDAPNIDPDGELSPEEEQRLFAHYGRSDYEAEDEVDQTSGVISPRESRRGEDLLGSDAPPVDHERRGPEGPTGRGENEDPVPPDGGAPPSNGEVPATGLPHVQGEESADGVPKPPGAPDGQEQPVSGVPKPAGAPDTDAVRAHGTGHEEIPMGGAKATPEFGPVSPSTAQDELEAPESPDTPGPEHTGGQVYRSRMRRYIAAEDEDRGPSPDGEGTHRDEL